MNTVLLVGTEEVTRAAARMTDAAAQMRSAADNIERVLWVHQQFLADWLRRYEDVLAKALEKS